MALIKYFSREKFPTRDSLLLDKEQVVDILRGTWLTIVFLSNCHHIFSWIFTIFINIRLPKDALDREFRHLDTNLHLPLHLVC